MDQLRTAKREVMNYTEDLSRLEEKLLRHRTRNPDSSGTMLEPQFYVFHKLGRHGDAWIMQDSVVLAYGRH